MRKAVSLPSSPLRAYRDPSVPGAPRGSLLQRMVTRPEPDSRNWSGACLHQTDFFERRPWHRPGSGRKIDRCRRPRQYGGRGELRTGFESGGAVAEAGIVRLIELLAEAQAPVVPAGDPLDADAVRPELSRHLHLVAAEVVAYALEAREWGGVRLGASSPRGLRNGALVQPCAGLRHAVGQP